MNKHQITLSCLTYHTLTFHLLNAAHICCNCWNTVCWPLHPLPVLVVPAVRTAWLCIFTTGNITRRGARHSSCTCLCFYNLFSFPSASLFEEQNDSSKVKPGNSLYPDIIHNCFCFFLKDNLVHFHFVALGIIASFMITWYSPNYLLRPGNTMTFLQQSQKHKLSDGQTGCKQANSLASLSKPLYSAIKSKTC